MVCVKDWRFMLWYVLYFIQNKYALHTLPTKKGIFGLLEFWQVLWLVNIIKVIYFELPVKTIASIIWVYRHYEVYFIFFGCFIGLNWDQNFYRKVKLLPAGKVKICLYYYVLRVIKIYFLCKLYFLQTVFILS